MTNIRPPLSHERIHTDNLLRRNGTATKHVERSETPLTLYRSYDAVAALYQPVRNTGRLSSVRVPWVQAIVSGWSQCTLQQTCTLRADG